MVLPKNQASVTIPSIWTLGGAPATVVVGDGTNPITVNITSQLRKATVNVSNAGTLILSNASYFSSGTNSSNFGTIDDGSTVNYNIAGLTVKALSYGNLTISEDATIASGVTTTNAVLTIAAGKTLSMSSSYLIINDLVSGTGLLAPDAGSSMSIYGSAVGNIGTINFTGATPTIADFELNFTNPSASVTFGGDLTVDGGVFSLTSGNLNLNGNILTVGNNGTDANLYASAANGYVIGSVNSAIYLNPVLLELEAVVQLYIWIPQTMH